KPPRGPGGGLKKGGFPMVQQPATRPISTPMLKPGGLPPLTVRSVAAVGVEIPMTFTLGTSRGRIAKAPLLLIDVATAEGVTGRAYLWSYFPRAMVAIAALLDEVEERTRGARVEPIALWR